MSPFLSPLRPGLQPWELPSAAGTAARDQALDPNDDSGEIDQNRGEGRSPRPPGYLPVGGSGSAPEVIPGNPLCDRPVETADSGSRMIDSLQPQFTAPDTMGVVSPWTDDLVAFWSCVGQERPNLADNGAPSRQYLDSRTRTEQIYTRSSRLTPSTTRTINPNGKSRIRTSKTRWL